MLTLENLTAFFGWTLAINVAFLVLSTVGVVSARGFISRIHGGMFGLQAADLSRAYFQYLAQYKIAIIIFSLTPYIALKVIA